MILYKFSVPTHTKGMLELKHAIFICTPAITVTYIPYQQINNCTLLEYQMHYTRLQFFVSK